jgi:putative flippase GtrA
MKTATGPAWLSRLSWYGGVGTLSAAIYALATWLLAKQLAWPAVAASCAAYTVAALVSYFGHRRLTFRSDRPHREAVSRFVALSTVSYTVAFVTPGIVSGLLQAPIELSIAIVCVLIPAINYLALSRLVFRVPESRRGSA